MVYHLTTFRVPQFENPCLKVFIFSIQIRRRPHDTKVSPITGFRVHASGTPYVCTVEVQNNAVVGGHPLPPHYNHAVVYRDVTLEGTKIDPAQLEERNMRAIINYSIIAYSLI